MAWTTGFGAISNGLAWQGFSDRFGRVMEGFGWVRIMSIGKSRLGSVCYVEMRSGLYVPAGLGLFGCGVMRSGFYGYARHGTFRKGMVWILRLYERKVSIEQKRKNKGAS